MSSGASANPSIINIYGRGSVSYSFLVWTRQNRAYNVWLARLVIDMRREDAPGVRVYQYSQRAKAFSRDSRGQLWVRSRPCQRRLQTYRSM